jgi:hypothetical protein
MQMQQRVRSASVLPFALRWALVATEIWILQECPAEDPAVEAAFSNYVLDNR